MKKSRKIEERIGIYGPRFYALLHKKASFPRVLIKKLCRVVVRLYRSTHYAMRLTPSGKSFFINNAIFK